MNLFANAIRIPATRIDANFSIPLPILPSLARMRNEKPSVSLLIE
jgi:hypothetical protein